MCVCAVSYTHLDVYKRQVVHISADLFCFTTEKHTLLKSANFVTLSNLKNISVELLLTYLNLRKVF